MSAEGYGDEVKFQYILQLADRWSIREDHPNLEGYVGDVCARFQGYLGSIPTFGHVCLQLSKQLWE
jgi:hypothetical protein